MTRLPQLERLVNALARQLVEVLVPDPQQAVDLNHVNEAKEVLIQQQDTHLDSLASILRENRVRAVIEPNGVESLARRSA